MKAKTDTFYDLFPDSRVIWIHYWNRRMGVNSVKKSFNTLEDFKVFALKQPLSHYKAVLRRGALSITLYTTEERATGEDLYDSISRVHECMTELGRVPGVELISVSTFGKAECKNAR
jgi:hypothetical protein